MLIEGIVITKSSAREHDQLVTLYTREIGKVRAVAKSILKAHSVQALQLDEGNSVSCELVSATGASIITGAQAQYCLSVAKSSPLRWAAASFFLQVFDRLVYEHQEDPELFMVLQAALGAMNTTADDAVLSQFRLHQTRLLAALGYGQVADGKLSSGRTRTEIDQKYEQLAQQRLTTLDLLYSLVR